MDIEKASKIAIKDLDNFTDAEIELLAKYYKIPFYTREQAIARLGPEIISQHYYTASFPNGNDCDPPERFKTCMNDRDYISLQCWTEDYTPEIQIRFLNPSDYSKTPQTLCLMVDDLKQMLLDDDSEFRGWYPSRKNNPIDPEGYGGRASDVEKYIKVFNYFVSNDPEELANTITSGIYNAYPLYTEKLIGNPDSTFGIGQIHGQSPGYTVYYVVKKGGNERKKVLQEIKRINKLKGTDVVDDQPESDIKDLIELELVDQTMLPLVDAANQLPPRSGNQESANVYRYQSDILDWFLNEQVENALLYGKRPDGDWGYIGVYGHPMDLDDDINNPDNDFYTEFLSSHIYTPDSLREGTYDNLMGNFNQQTPENKAIINNIIYNDYQGMQYIGEIYENRTDEEDDSMEMVYESDDDMDLEPDEWGF